MQNQFLGVTENKSIQKNSGPDNNSRAQQDWRHASLSQALFFAILLVPLKFV
jgi:hypothetical protein